MTPALIIGSRSDPHVQAVSAALGPDNLVVDAAELPHAHFEYAPPAVRIRVGKQAVEIGDGCKGWIRRLSPISWESGTQIGSHEAAVKSSWLSLLAAILRHPRAEWLSSLDAMNASENKLTQSTVASQLGIDFPKTVVSNDPACIRRLSSPLVAKPLGPGHYQAEDGNWLTVFTEDFNVARAEDRNLLSGPPFLVQERVKADAHLRVVTVEDQAWVFRIPAEGLPIDWREEPRAHREWELVDDEDLGSNALRVNSAFDIRYSSQDWIQTDQKQVFIDLNPSGQWLFLPEAGSQQITQAIALWMNAS